MSNKRVRRTNQKMKELKKQKVYYLKDNEIYFEYKNKVVRMKEFHRDGLSWAPPFTEEQAKAISHANNAYLKIRK